MEPSKLKVAELRAELQARGLDSKGVKAILVDRLEQALIAEAEEAEQAEADSVEEIGDDDDEVEQAQEALPEAEQGFGEEFGFTEDSADAGDMMQEDDLLQGDDGEGTEGDDEQLLAELDVPQAMEEPEAEPEPEPAAEAVPESAEPVAEPQVEPMEEQAQQPAEEAQEAPKEAEQQEPEAAAESSDAKPDGMEQEEAPKTDDQENKEPATEEDKKDDDKNKERKRDYENRNRDRRVGGRDRSPRRRTPPPAVVMEEDDDIPDTQCVLSKYLSDLNLKIGKDGYSASPLSMEGFAYMWGGVKSTHGVSKGRIGYECKLESQADVRHLPPEETNRHVVRVGWSTDPTSLQLGEEAFSYGYGGTGKASVNCVFSDFGGKFGVNDVITSYVDFEGEKPTISYSKNGEDLGVAFTIEDDLNGQALFPHVMVKNISVEMNFGQREEPWFPLKEEFTFIGKLSEEDTVRGPKPPATKKECEDVVAVLVGFAGEWNPAIVPMRHVLEGKAVQQTFVTVMRTGVLLRGRVVSVLRKAEEVDELGKYLPQVHTVQRESKVKENVLMTCDGIVTKSMQSLLETRLVSLYKTSVEVSAAFPEMARKSKPLIDAQQEEAKRGLLNDVADQKMERREQESCDEASSKREQKGGVLEGILTTFSSLNQTLGSIDTKLSNMSEVTKTLGSIDGKLTMALQAVEKRADAQGKKEYASPSDGKQGRKASARRDSTGRRGSISRRSSLSFLSKNSPRNSTKSKSPRSSFIPLDDRKVKKQSSIGKCTVAGQRKSDVPSQTKSLTRPAVGQTKSSAIPSVGQNKSMQGASGQTRPSAQGAVGPRKSVTPAPLCETKLPSHGVGIRRKSLALPTPSKPYLTTAEADKIFRSSANYRICALRLARKLLPGKSNVDGMPEPGKDGLVGHKETVARSSEIKRLIFELYNIPAKEQDTVWKDCSQLIAHSFTDEDKPSSPFPGCPKLVGSRGRIQ